MTTGIKRRLCRTVCLLGALALLSGCVSQPSREDTNREAALETYYKLAIGYLENGNRESARHHIQQAFELDSRSSRAYAAQALLMQSEGEPERAEESFRKALRYDDDFSQARNNYGAFLFQQGRYKEAYKQFARASEDLDYNNRARALLNLGRAALELDRRDKAKASFEQALNLNDKLAPALLELAHMEFEAQNYADAKRYLDRYADVRRHSARSLLLGIKIESIFGNEDKKASYVMGLKNRFPYSDEYLEYKQNLSD